MNLSKRGNGSRSDGDDIDVNDKDGVDLVLNAVHCVDEMCDGKQMDVMKRGWRLHLVVGAGMN